mgnify:CR=1 FL=1
MNKIIIAIDGFSSCGKSTMAKDLAKEIGYIYIDSGAMYRAVTLYCIEHGLFLADGSIDEDKLKQQMSTIHISFRLDTESGRRKPDPDIRGILTCQPCCSFGICT